MSRSLNASSILGANATSGLVTAIENWTIVVRATENFYHRHGGGGPTCERPYRTTWFYGCEAHSLFEVGAAMVVWDNTSHASVASSTGPSGWGDVAQKTRCTHSGAYCSAPGGNRSVDLTIHASFRFSATLSATHQYFLVTTFSANLTVLLAGWMGVGSARVNLATNGHHAALSAVRIT